MQLRLQIQPECPLPAKVAGLLRENCTEQLLMWRMRLI